MENREELNGVILLFAKSLSLIFRKKKILCLLPQIFSPLLRADALMKYNSTYSQNTSGSHGALQRPA